ncbi:DUF1064 domain-containing protein [uncultured Treponema sp.]|jgi:hypothetical protein|uniref:DUF1064 domain-containing protein n=1 Tax=uncultured Treponema sp. TaxID=162155 RepID=UPI00280A6C08|nr:DUF1064 domain-containing protein [uncultured Treponema sp.]
MASKYRNIKCIFSGIKFDSKKEAARYAELAMLERAGRISGLERQVRFEVCPKVPGLKGSRSRHYVADFVYTEGGKKVIEDVKSWITKKNPVYKLKKQLVQVNFPEYEFREIL